LPELSVHIIQITGSGQYRNKKWKNRNKKWKIEDNNVPAKRNPQATVAQVKRQVQRPQMINESYARRRLED
jgi:hypothetical protein